MIIDRLRAPFDLFLPQVNRVAHSVKHMIYILPEVLNHLQTVWHYQAASRISFLHISSASSHLLMEHFETLPKTNLDVKRLIPLVLVADLTIAIATYIIERLKKTVLNGPISPLMDIVEDGAIVGLSIELAKTALEPIEDAPQLLHVLSVANPALLVAISSLIVKILFGRCYWHLNEVTL